MLTATFQHIPGVGETREKMLWERGCTSWDTYLENPDKYRIGDASHRQLKAGILESKSRLETLDHRYFKKHLPSGITWRAYNKFCDYACFIDIETTGLSPYDSHVTTVCVHSNTETNSYVRGQNLHKLKQDLKKYRYIVSFNGARFDLPFLTSDLSIGFPQIHLDLMYPLSTLGYRGGLKSIEKQLGLSRDTEGVSGKDAVYLWYAYKNGSKVKINGETFTGQKALDLLVQYNEEDTVNLQKLAETVVGRLENQLKQKSTSF